MNARPELLIVSGVWPHVIGNREAANVVCHEIVKHLALQDFFKLSYCVINAGDVEMPAAAAKEVSDLEQQGVRFLKPVKIPVSAAAGPGIIGKALALLAGRPDRIYPGTGQHQLLLDRLDGKLPDAILSVWSEQAGYVISSLNTKLFNYAGNPDHKVFEARSELSYLGRKKPVLRALRDRARLAIARAGHLQAMRRFDLMWNVAANDAADYAAAGVNARYLQNMWPGSSSSVWKEIRASSSSDKSRPLKIIGNVGNMAATGNSYGLLSLATGIAPKLKDRMGEGNFEIHLFGGGRPHPAIASLLDDKHIVMRGFVDDLDSEILSAPIFLVANNSERFKVGHTRFLHAWSLGSCVVAFADSREAMPEIVHRKNALLGQTAEEIADLIVEAAGDAALRFDLGLGGINTLKRAFDPSAVVDVIAADIRRTLADAQKIGNQTA